MGGGREAEREPQLGRLKKDTSRNVDDARHPSGRWFPGVKSPGVCRQQDASANYEKTRPTARVLKASSLWAPSKRPVTHEKFRNVISQRGDPN